MRILPALSAFVLACLLFSGSAHAGESATTTYPANGKANFDFPTHHFRIWFPEKPKRLDVDKRFADGEYFKVENDGAEMVAGHFQTVFDDLEEVVLHKSVENTMDKVGASTWNAKDIKYLGYPGQDITAQQADGQKLLARFYVINSHLFMTMYTHTPQGLDQAEAQTFLNSFEVMTKKDD